MGEGKGGAIRWRVRPTWVYLPHHPSLRDRIAAEFQDHLRGAGIDATVTFLERRRND
jgi:hypothetical protein